MRAVICTELGGAEKLALMERPEPEAGEGQVVIQVAAAGLNFADSLIIAGKYQEKPAPPFVPGFEVAGRVQAVGSGVSRFKPGDPVLALPDWGGFAEKIAVPAEHVFAMPGGVDVAVAAGFAINYGTAHGALRWHARLQPGETLLVHGAAGGTGLAAVEIGKAMGARVIATAGGAEKLAVAQAHGADELIDYRSEDIRTRVKDLTGGKGADVVFDPVGGHVFDASLRCVAWGGRLLVIGFAGGKVSQIPANHLLVKNVAAMGVYWGSYRKHRPDMLAQQFEELFGWLKEGQLKPLITQRFPLERAAEAIKILIERKSTGKMVLTMDETVNRVS